mmetsp:Transcript_96007/g.248296  ORF Transcript_96007/g.248296 Transcript_96007/m.248296 type:complete len:200 (-) Transcript_96007:739-1338(-)
MLTSSRRTWDAQTAPSRPRRKRRRPRKMLTALMCCSAWMRPSLCTHPSVWRRRRSARGASTSGMSLACTAAPGMSGADWTHWACKLWRCSQMRFVVLPWRSDSVARMNMTLSFTTSRWHLRRWRSAGGARCYEAPASGAVPRRTWQSFMDEVCKGWSLWRLAWARTLGACRSWRTAGCLCTSSRSRPARQPRPAHRFPH